MSRSVKFIQESDLPIVGELYFEMADAMAGEPLSRDMVVTDIRRDQSTGLIITEHFPTEEQMTVLGVLKTIRDIKSYRGRRYETSRQNVQMVARLGGYAAYGVYGIAPEGGFSFDALSGIRNSLLTVQGKMENAFGGIVRPIPKDQNALKFLNRASTVLRGDRSTD